MSSAQGLDVSRTDTSALKFGNYTLLRKLGQGGMAEIYLALRSGLGIAQLTVIKRIRTDQMTNEDLVKMFLDEARIAATLNHPNVCQIHEIGEVAGRHYLAMEYLHGCDVRGLCKQLARKRQPLPVEHSLYVVNETAAGLHYAHQRKDLQGRPLNIIHRDVSPQNIFVTFEGAVKLLDFGIAKAANRDVETRSGVLKGKLTYMSPEQVQGKELAPGSDVFALAIVLWELTTGKRLFKADTDYAVLRKIVDKDIPPPTSIWPDYSKELEAIVLKGLAKDPNERYATAKDFQMALRGFMRSQGLVSGAPELAAFMQDVFAERLADEKAELEAGRELYEILRDRESDSLGDSDSEVSAATVASRPDVAAPPPEESEDDLPEPTRVTTSAESISLAAGVTPAAESGGPNLLLILGIAVFVILLAVGGYFVLATGDDADEIVDPDSTAEPVTDTDEDLKKSGEDTGDHEDTAGSDDTIDKDDDDAVGGDEPPVDTEPVDTGDTAGPTGDKRPPVHKPKVGKGKGKPKGDVEPTGTKTGKSRPATSHPKGVGDSMEDPFKD